MLHWHHPMCEPPSGPRRVLEPSQRYFRRMRVDWYDSSRLGESFGSLTSPEMWDNLADSSRKFVDSKWRRKSEILSNQRLCLPVACSYIDQAIAATASDIGILYTLFHSHETCQGIEIGSGQVLDIVEEIINQIQLSNCLKHGSKVWRVVKVDASVTDSSYNEC